jgi:hypothetical protein
MRKLLLTLASILTYAGMVFGGVAAAQTCSITNTGSNSTNVAECASLSQFTINCTNNTVVVIDNNQLANSGSSVIISNTNSIYTTNTGSAVNVNSDKIALNVGCAPKVAAVPAPAPAPTPTPPITPAPTPTPVSVAPAPAPVAAPVKALPTTGDNSAATFAGIAVAALAGVAIAARFGLAAYNRFSLK